MDLALAEARAAAAAGEVPVGCVILRAAEPVKAETKQKLAALLDG